MIDIPKFDIKVDPEVLSKLRDQITAALIGFGPFEHVKMKEPTFMEEIKSALQTMILGLLRSRKVALALLGLVATLVAHYTNIPPEVWGAIDALLLAVIGGIAWEDSAEKR